MKSKSMVSEEIELDHVLEAAGIRAVETDFGEYIVQVAHQRPVHIVGPALHMSAADVGRLFAEKLGEPFTEDHTKLCDIARLRGARNICKPTWACRAATSPWPTAARLSLWKTRGTPAFRPPRRRYTWCW